MRNIIVFCMIFAASVVGAATIQLKHGNGYPSVLKNYEPAVQKDGKHKLYVSYSGGVATYFPNISSTTITGVTATNTTTPYTFATLSCANNGSSCVARKSLHKSDNAGILINSVAGNVGRIAINAYGGTAQLALGRYNGTVTAPTQTLSGQLLGEIYSKGYGTAGFTASSIRSYATEDHTSNGSTGNGGTKLTFAVNPNGAPAAGSGTVALTLNQDYSATFRGDITAANFANPLNGSTTWDPPSVGTGGTTTTTITVTGANLGDYCMVSAPYDLQTVQAACYVSSSNTVTIRIYNPPITAVDLASGTWKVRVYPQ
jgi:hypothetical protein